MTTTTDKGLTDEELLAIVEAAAPGSYVQSDGTPSRVDTPSGAISITWSDSRDENPFERAERQAAFTATFDPPMVRALIERARAAEAERDHYRGNGHQQALRARDAETRALAMEEALKAITDAAPRLPDSFRWTGTERAEDLFDAELRHESGKTPVDYLRAWLNMFRPFAYATRDDSWGELEKLICITMNNVVKTYAAIEEARAPSPTEAQS